MRIIIFIESWLMMTNKKGSATDYYSLMLCANCLLIKYTFTLFSAWRQIIYGMFAISSLGVTLDTHIIISIGALLIMAISWLGASWNSKIVLELSVYNTTISFSALHREKEIIITIYSKQVILILIRIRMNDWSRIYM
jgi:hypothetical protein